LLEISREAIRTAKNPVKLSFQNLNYTVAVKTTKQEASSGMGSYKKVKVLKDCSGFALPGQTTFIMGASGAGKTSLLNALSDRISLNSKSVLDGKIQFNDRYDLNSNLFGKYATYVMQDDVVFAYFTVKEALTFAARLKLKVSHEEQDERVNKLIDDLGLLSCQNTPVGDVYTKTISGGERKRTAIGVELITDPSVVLLDEPTSGLDSMKAVKLVGLLQSLARQGKTIISTIHAPSSAAFAHFDRLILMADGNIVFQDDAKNCPKYFHGMGQIMKRH